MISEEPTLSLSATLKPSACRACAYSAPRMFCSEKFLSPTVTAGLPTPGPLAAAAGVLAELELDDDLLLPQAASAMLSAATSRADTAPARWWLRLLLLLPGILASWCWVLDVVDASG